MLAIPADLENWLRLFSKAVRGRDFSAGRALFDGAVTAFGTVCSRAESLDELVSCQWQAVWPQTTGFDFDYVTARAMTAVDWATVIAGWRSTGFANGGKPVERLGRATLVLHKSAAGWKAVHTHFSINPQSSDHDPVLRHARPC